MSGPDDIHELALNAAAKVEAEWDGRTYEALGRADKQRYMDRFYAGLQAYSQSLFPAIRKED